MSIRATSSSNKFRTKLFDSFVGIILPKPRFTPFPTQLLSIPAAIYVVFVSFTSFIRTYHRSCSLAASLRLTFLSVTITPQPLFGRTYKFNFSPAALSINNCNFPLNDAVPQRDVGVVRGKNVLVYISSLVFHFTLSKTFDFVYLFLQPVVPIFAGDKKATIYVHIWFTLRRLLPSFFL